MTNHRCAGLACGAGFALCIPLANWTLDRYGFVRVTGLGPVASGVVWVGLAFVLRDVVQLTLGKTAAALAIIAGVVMSAWFASPGLAVASGWAFAVSESMDMAIYTPLAKRRFLLAVALSSWAGSFIDSALFLRIAFGGYGGWWQLAVAKSVIVAATTPVAWAVRRALSRDFAGRRNSAAHA